jgi:hypothetical protein
MLAGPAVLIWNHSSNSVVEGNSFLNCARGIAFGLEDVSGNDHSGGIIRNNVFYRSAAQPGDVAIQVADSPNTQVLNNTVLVSGTYPYPIEYRFAGTTGVVIKNNLLDGAVLARDAATGTVQNNVTSATSAMFVSASTGDLHLKSTATAAIDRGVTVAGVIDDWDGEARPIGSAPDVGADEFSGTIAATYAIGGHVRNSSGAAVSGVTVTLSGSSSATQTDDTSGAYNFTNLAGGGNYTITPSKSGVSFTPASWTYSPLAANQSAADFNGAATSTPPAVSLTAPASGATFTAPATIAVAASASSTGSSISKVDFYVGTTLIGTDTTSPYSVSWTVQSAGIYSLTAVARDAAGNTTTSSGMTVTVNGVSGACPCSLWPATATPGRIETGDTSAVELGMRIKADTDGTISGVRFYKAVGSAGPHVGHLWTNTGTLLGTISFSAETASGWQQANFLTPIAVTANTTYVVSYYAPAGQYAADVNYFATGLDKAPLHAPADSGAGANGVYRYVASGFPASTYQASNYWVDVVFAPGAAPPPGTTPSVVSLTAPATGATFTAPATIAVAASASSTSSSISKVDFYVGTTLIGTDTTSPFSMSWTVQSAGTYSLTAVATDALGSTTRSAVRSITVANSSPPPPVMTVTLTSPSSGTRYLAPITIALAADASTTSGTITKVEFFNGSTLIGSDTTAPYGGTWSNVAAGTYVLSAKTTTSGGVTATSAPVSVTVNSVPTTPPPASGGLVQSSNLVYQGAFRVPAITVAGNPYAEFDYGGTAPAFNPAHNSLFLVSHVYTQMTAELGIPSSLGTGPVSSLPQATALHTFVDALAGKLHSVAPDPNTTVYIGGQYVYAPGQMVVSAYTYYAGSPTASHFSRSTDLNSAAAAGPFNISAGIGPWAVSFVSGYMGGIPAAWQAALGGPALTGDCCLGVVSRTSYGPAAFAFDPANLTPTAAQPLVYYDGGGDPTHATLGNWVNSGPANPLYNSSSVVTGVVFPEGSSSVLFFGTQGLGPACYGIGGVDCVDPEGSAKGVHGYPYVYYVWAYDAHDLAAVHAGTKQPWEVKPYAVWSLNLPYAPNGQGHHMGGAAYDPATGRIFISQQFADGDLPVIHVFKVQ